jgi:hypothetical protein
MRKNGKIHIQQGIIGIKLTIKESLEKITAK